MWDDGAATVPPRSWSESVRRCWRAAFWWSSTTSSCYTASGTAWRRPTATWTPSRRTCRRCWWWGAGACPPGLSGCVCEGYFFNRLFYSLFYFTVSLWVYSRWPQNRIIAWSYFIEPSVISCISSTSDARGTLPSSEYTVTSPTKLSLKNWAKLIFLPE